jgi:phytoene desaturase
VGQTAVVVGAGFAGIATAAVLARNGFDVVVLEKNHRPGGRAMVCECDGFRFDMGPSWYLMPKIFERFFEMFGQSPSSYYQLVRLDPSYRVFFGPDDTVDISSDLETNIRTFERIESGSGPKLREYLEIASVQYRAAVDEFLYRDYRSLLDFFNRKTLLEGRKLHVFESLDRYAARFFKSDRLRKILEYSTVFLGGSPRNTPAMYSLLSHVDFNLGVWYPLGGIGKVVDGLQALAESFGARFLFDHEVTSVATRDSRVVSIRTRRGDFDADVVVITADYPYAETTLIEPRSRSYPLRYWESRVMAPSAFLMYVGLRKPLDGLRHHTLWFEHDWMEHFDSIFQRPGWPEKPSYYICCPTKTDATVSPPGHETLVVLVPVAAGIGDDDSTRERFADKALRSMENLLGEPVRDNIVTLTMFGPRDFARTFNAFKGTALGLSHTLRQTAVFRPKHRSRKLRNLYFAGQYTHPGIGLPMALISATIVGNIVTEEHGGE